jgi:2,3-dihydroxybiphenyl 1,2-dioxygenase
MYRQIELAYLGIQIPEPTALDTFFGDVIGLSPGEPAGAATSTWRDDHKAHRILVEAGDANDATYLGFEAIDADAFDATAAQIAAAGFVLTEGTVDECAARGVERMLATDAPWGVRLELDLGLAQATEPFTSPTMPSGFHTQGVGFGHVVFATTDFDESHRFATDALGLRQSDWLEMELAPGIVLEVRFYHCNERHHSLAFARAPFELPQTLHHVMFETNERDDVGAAFDRAWASGLPIPNGLGRHDNDGMFSFYVQSPAGFQVVVGHGARVVPAEWDDNRRYDQISAWGHQQLRQA